MADYLTRLLRRARGEAPMLAPRRASRFEPAPGVRPGHLDVREMLEEDLTASGPGIEPRTGTPTESFQIRPDASERIAARPAAESPQPVRGAKPVPEPTPLIRAARRSEATLVPGKPRVSPEVPREIETRPAAHPAGRILPGDWKPTPPIPAPRAETSGLLRPAVLPSRQVGAVALTSSGKRDAPANLLVPSERRNLKQANPEPSGFTPSASRPHGPYGNSPAHPHDSERSTPAIQVTIARIEVKAVPTGQSVPQTQAQGGPRLSLDEYLRSRSGGSK